MEKIDLDFNRFIREPAVDYRGTLMLYKGFGEQPARSTNDCTELLEVVQGDSGVYAVDLQVDAMLLSVCYAYDSLRTLHSGSQLLTLEEVQEFVSTDEHRERAGVHTFDEEVAWLTYRYLSGQGDDIDRFEELREMLI